MGNYCHLKCLGVPWLFSRCMDVSCVISSLGIFGILALLKWHQKSKFSQLSRVSHNKQQSKIPLNMTLDLKSMFRSLNTWIYFKRCWTLKDSHSFNWSNLGFSIFENSANSSLNVSISLGKSTCHFAGRCRLFSLCLKADRF